MAPSARERGRRSISIRSPLDLHEISMRGGGDRSPLDRRRSAEIGGDLLRAREGPELDLH
jgi:hypothetical protein